MQKLWGQHKLAIIITTVISLAVLGGVLAVFSRTKPPDPEKEPENAVRFIASSDFNRLSMEQKQDYLRHLRQPAEGEEGRARGGMLRNTQLSEEERVNLMTNMRPVFQAMQKERMEKFFSMSKEEQNQELDRMIKQMDERRAQRQTQAGERRPRAEGTPPAQDGNQQGRVPGGQGRQAPTAQQMKNRYENSDPLTRARLIEYRKAMSERRAGRR